MNERSALAMWVNLLQTIPDTLHMELRVGEELLTQIFQELLMDRTDIASDMSKTKYKESRLADSVVVVGFLISHNDFSNFNITLEPNSEVISKIGMNNDRLRKIFEGMHDVIDVLFTEDERIRHAPTISIIERVVTR